MRPTGATNFKLSCKRTCPRIPLAPGGLSTFKSFQEAGRELFELHVNYEDGPEANLEVISEGEDFRIHDAMRFRDDKTVLEVNPTCRIVGIPASVHSYQISGRSPLEWAVDSLRVKRDTKSGIVDDVNGWRSWKNDPYELIRHLLRLAYIGIRTSEIVSALPPSLPSKEI